MGNLLMINSSEAKELLNFDDGKKIIRQIYLLHEEGKTILPHSIFLKPDSRNRIIGLPATVLGEVNVSGIKWVSSYIDNCLQGIPRASSIIILNDIQTGYPFCCINGAFINLFRTSCSAFTVAEKYSRDRVVSKLGIVGAGAIAGCFVDCIKYFGGIPVTKLRVFDKKVEKSEKLIQEKKISNSSISNSVEELIIESDVIFFATTASEPYIFNSSLFSHNPLILNISLRDLSPKIIVASNNIVDDIDHVNRENTSIQLANKQTGNINFINGSIAMFLHNDLKLDTKKPTIFSPFGLGILDIAIGKYIYNKARDQNRGTVIKNFFN